MPSNVKRTPRYILTGSALACLLISATPWTGAMANELDSDRVAPQGILTVDKTTRIGGTGAPSDVAFLGPHTGGTEPLVISALGEHGLAWHHLDGTLAGQVDHFDSSLVEVLRTDEAFNAPGNGLTVATTNALTGRLHLLAFSATTPTLTEISGQAIELDDELTGLCHTFSALSRDWQIFGVSDAGMVHQWTVDPTGQRAPRLLRSIPVGKGAAHCVVDGQTRTLYLSHESQGVLYTGAEAESDPAFTFLAQNEPWGALSDEVKGLALLPGRDGAYLLVSDVGSGTLAVLHTATATLAGRLAVTSLGEGEGLATFSTDKAGYLAIADEDGGPDGSGLLLLDWQDSAARLGLSSQAYLQEKAARATPATRWPAAVRPVAETKPVNSFGDAADDPAIWVHPTQPERSLILGSQKQRGVYLYDLRGEELQFLDAGRINNIDLRDGFPMGGLQRTLVAGSDRTRKGIALFLLDGPGQSLQQLDDSFIATDLTDPYGLCLYHSALDGRFHVFVNDSIDGRTLQFALQDDGQGGITHERLRDIPVGAQAEGCVADDETGALFVAEEEHGIWKYGAEADRGNARSLVDSFENGRLIPDVEGLALWKTLDNTAVDNASNAAQTPHGGYLVASNQGRDSYLLYDRLAPHAFVGEFFIVAGNGIDGASETDGLEVTSAHLGPDYPAGLLVVQDGRNLGPRERQNFKLVSWRDIQESLNLP